MKKGTAIFPGWLFPFVYCVAGVDAYIKIAKTAGNKSFLAVFAVFVGVQFAPSEHSRGLPDAGIWAPARLAQGIIKKYAKIK